MDYEVVVIGSGSAGKEAALLAAGQGYRVVVIEKEALGGACFHRGCLPIRALRAYASSFGNHRFTGPGGVNLARAQIQKSWADVRRQVSDQLAERLNRQFQEAHVTVRFGQATFREPNRLRLVNVYGDWTELTAEQIVIATGSRPGFFGPGELKLVNSDQLLQSTDIPGHLLIIGGGYVGCEFASIFRAFGSSVTLVEQHPRLLPRWDADASAQLLESLCRTGVDVILGNKLDNRQISYQPGAPLQVEAGRTTLKPDLVLLATGRLPNVEGLGLETLGIRTQPFIEVDRCMRTSQGHIYAIGDVNGLSMFDSTALAQAQTAIDAICGNQTNFEPRAIPQCIYTNPPMAAVGWMESEAIDAGMDVIAGSETTQWIADEALRMLDPYPTRIKVVLDARTKKLLGCLAIGEQAVEVANICSIMLKSDISNEQLAGFRFAHPSAAEALQRCVKNIINQRENAGSVHSGGIEPQPVARESEAEPLERYRR